MSKYKISVIIPIYNAEKYLEQCLLSVFHQTFDSIEVILVNDGSTDSSEEIINRFAEDKENVIVVNQPNCGIAKARTAGYMKATGDYIGWVDNDDFIEPMMYEKLYNAAVTENADYIYCDYDFYPNKVLTKEKWFKEFKGIVDWHFIERNTHPWNKLVSRSLCEKIEMSKKLPVFGDSVYVDLLVHANKIVCIKEMLYHYRVGHESVSGSYKGRVEYYKEVAERAAKQKVFIEDTIYKNTLETYFEYRNIYALLQLCVVSAVNNDRLVYQETVNKLLDAKYKDNPLLKAILKENFGTLKAFVLRDIIPSSYLLSHIICKVVFR